MRGKDGGRGGVDDGFSARSMRGVGAWIPGEALFAGIDWRDLGYRCVDITAGEGATHVILAKQA